MPGTPNGNLTFKSNVASYTYPAQGPGSIRPHAPASLNNGALPLTYDANGNLTQGLGRALAWDGENRLLWSLQGGAYTGFVYGPDGARLKKWFWPAGGGGPLATTLYLGADIEVPLTAGTFIGAPVADQWRKHPTEDARIIGNANISFFHRDHLRSVKATTNISGGLAKLVVFKPQGETLTSFGAADGETKGFTGERADPETGLLYLNARYYDPNLGLFISPDWWDAAKAGVGTNRYMYAHGDAVNRSDRNGHDSNGPEPSGSGLDNRGNPSPGNATGSGAAGAGGGVPGVTARDDELMGYCAPCAVSVARGLFALTAAVISYSTTSKISTKATPTVAARTTVDEDDRQRTYQTYTKTDPVTGTVYSGRTSGFGTPEENVAKRDKSHAARDALGYDPAVVDKSSVNYDAIRGREQMSIDFYGGSIRSGGTSGNMINGVDINNPRARDYEEAAIAEFGRMAR